MVNILYDNCFISSYKTKVKEVVEDNGLFWHALEETIFFCESGGMASDEGLINQHKVMNLKKEHDVVWHLLDTKLEGKVELSIDFHLRLTRSQVHTAQHLISGMMESIYRYKTLSHHVHDKGNDIEFDAEEITPRQLRELEVLVNGLIRADLPVHAFYPTKLEATKYSPKNMADLIDLRIIKIGNIIETPCGCIHVPSLRYLQMIKITGTHKASKGIKVTYVCGDQLLHNYETYEGVLQKAGTLLAQPYEFVEVGILKLMQDIRTLSADNVVIREKYMEQVVQSLPSEEGLYRCFDDMDLRTFQALCSKYKETHSNFFVFLWKQATRMHLYVGAKEKSDVIFNVFKEALDINGGGNATYAQGGGTLKEECETIVLKIMEQFK